MQKGTLVLYAEMELGNESRSNIEILRTVFMN